MFFTLPLNSNKICDTLVVINGFRHLYLILLIVFVIYTKQRKIYQHMEAKNKSHTKKKTLLHNVPYFVRGFS